MVLRDLGKLEEAVTSYRKALALKPDLAETHYNLAMVLLLRGDFVQGWQEYEWRWQTAQMKLELRNFPQPQWQGQSLPHGTILLRTEQGLGDTIQFIRFAALVKERVGTVLCTCPPSLVRLLRTCAGIDGIIPIGEPLPAFDVQVPLMSLPGILQTTLETIPAPIPYLQADAALTETQAHALANTNEFKVGIVWQGNPRRWNANFLFADRLRSIPLLHFEPLAQVPGVRLISLQKGFGTEQLRELAGRFSIAELPSGCNNYSEAARPPS